MHMNTWVPVQFPCMPSLHRCAQWPMCLISFSMGNPWSHQCLSSAQPNRANLARKPNQASAEATLRNQARNRNICRKSRNFIELSILCNRDIEKPKNRKNGVGKRRIPIRRDRGESTLSSCQSHESWGTVRPGYKSCSPLIRQVPSALLLWLLKAREGTPG